MDSEPTQRPPEPASADPSLQETKWREITPDDFIRLRTTIPGIIQVSIRNGWALVFDNEPVAVWKTDIRMFRNSVWARVT